MTEQEARELIGKVVVLYWNDEGGKEQSMEGLVVKVDDEGYIQVDYGYGVIVSAVTRHEVLAECHAEKPGDICLRDDLH